MPVCVLFVSHLAILLRTGGTKVATVEPPATPGYATPDMAASRFSTFLESFDADPKTVHHVRNLPLGRRP